MDPQRQFCHNPDCPDRGQVGRGNIGVLSRKERRYQCSTCGKTFVETKGTPFLPTAQGGGCRDTRAHLAPPSA